MTPTPEQEQAIALFKQGGSLAIEAGAGTGKTSTLVLIAKAAGNRNGQYVAFNKALVEDSRPKFPMSVTCNTAHSLAFRAVGKEYAPRLNYSTRMLGREMAVRLGIVMPIEARTFDGKPKALYPGYVASLANQTVTKFCQSADDVIGKRHVPFVQGLDEMSQWALREAVVPLAQTMWADLQNHYGWVPYKHEHYLKTWQLRDPKISADFVLFDESQDANPVIAAIVAAQASHAQLVYVGDSQQEIYAWTGAVNALAKVDVEHRAFLTQSFRFGQAIADRANVVLDGLDAAIRLTGNPSIDSSVGEVDTPQAILCRTNAQAVTHLLGAQARERKAFMVGGAGEVLAFARGAQELIDTGHSPHPDLICFDSWSAVQAYTKEEAGGEDLRLLVKLIDSFGSEAIVRGLEQMPNENRADLIISTAHKSKGREWSSVKLANDFPQTADSTPADQRLLYVAITRAKEQLDMTTLDGIESKEAIA